LQDPRLTIRLDRWLWFARFFKTRGLATKVVSGGHVRVNASKVSKPSHAVGVGDTLTFPQGNRVRVVRLLATGDRRGPASEAQTLYEDIFSEQTPVPAPVTTEGKGRPTKKDRRDMRLSRDAMLE
jgi:ribosome-associated heat shock protein Hsp15